MFLMLVSMLMSMLTACAAGPNPKDFDVVVREGGHSGWLNDNLHEAENAPTPKQLQDARWTYNYEWDPEQRLRELWKWVGYKK